MYAHHHYHSNTHEFLGVVGGRAELKIGGEQGIAVDVALGDALVLPAGTGHKRLSASRGFRVLGAYPGGEQWDINTGEPGERPEVLENIRRVGAPDRDPLFGEDGPVVTHLE
ncbi:MAG: cupin domain-containing protein [Bradymonadaceae bacterium]